MSLLVMSKMTLHPFTTLFLCLKKSCYRVFTPNIIWLGVITLQSNVGGWQVCNDHIIPANLIKII